MTFKKLAMWWLFSVIALGGLAFSYAGIAENGDAIAEWSAPTYVPLSEEEIFRRAQVPCRRPAGATSGCAYPDVAAPALTGDVLADSASAKIALLDRQRARIAIQTPEYEHREQYFEREVRPRRDRLRVWSGIVAPLAAAAVALNALARTTTWWRSRRVAHARDTGRGSGRPGLASAVRRFMASRKLQRVENAFETLKNLHDNGLISDAAFAQRKDTLRAAAENANASESA